MCKNLAVVLNIGKNALYLKAQYASLHEKEGCYLQPVTIIVTGWSYPIKNKIIMNGDVS